MEKKLDAILLALSDDERTEMARKLNRKGNA